MSKATRFRTQRDNRKAAKAAPRKTPARSGAQAKPASIHKHHERRRCWIRVDEARVGDVIKLDFSENVGSPGVPVYQTKQGEVVITEKTQAIDSLDFYLTFNTGSRARYGSADLLLLATGVE